MPATPAHEASTTHFTHFTHLHRLGIVQRQGIRNTLISYVGLAIGFVNTILVLPRLLSAGQIGLDQRAGVAGHHWGAAGCRLALPAWGMRYFPYFRNQGRNHAGFLPLLLGLPLLGFVVVAGSCWWASRWCCTGTPADDAALLSPHYGAAIALAGCIMLGALQDAYLKSLFHTSFSSFCQEILLRLLHGGGGRGL